MKDISSKAILTFFSVASRKLLPYTGFFLFLLIAAIYAFTVVQINKYSNPVVGDDEVLAEVEISPTPTIDENAARKLLLLRDNSVNVQTLLEEDRTNPFRP